MTSEQTGAVAATLSGSRDVRAPAARAGLRSPLALGALAALQAAAAGLGVAVL
ncbi:MAG: hypothetical protein AVDCRST_MAG35-1352, partial [uncultured Quadrisphaera sp.]